MPILDQVIGSGISPFAATAITGGVTTLALTSTNTSQATAQLLGSGTGYVSICSSSGRTVQLPACGPSSSVTIYNGGANAVNVYGQTGDAIQNGSANAAFAIASHKAATFTRVTATAWGANLSA